MRKKSRLTTRFRASGEVWVGAPDAPLRPPSTIRRDVRFPGTLASLLRWSLIFAIAPWSDASAGLAIAAPTPTPTETATPTAAPQDLPAYIRANYTKHEHEIAMRDGVAAHRDLCPKDQSRRYAI